MTAGKMDMTLEQLTDDVVVGISWSSLEHGVIYLNG